MKTPDFSGRHAPSTLMPLRRQFKPQILVIDDDQVVRESFVWALRSGGYEVLVASDGAEAITICRQCIVDLVLTNIFMPVKGGLESIVDLHIEFPRVPILAFSGGYLMSDTARRMARQLGVVDVFELPFETHGLLKLVEKALSSSDLN